MKKCSIIVPLYRGKQYIRECIESIVNQTYSCWELILMDDGSPDDTYDFVSGIIAEYPNFNIKLLRQENAGVAVTRNKCVRLSDGDYIAFMDQDDTIEKDYIEKLMSAAEEGDYDIVLCGYVRKSDAGKILKTVKLSDDSWSKYMIVAPWARIYKRSFLVENDLNFLKTACGEDTYLTIRAYAITEKIKSIVNYTGYIWRYNTTSISNTKQKSITMADVACETFEKIMEDLPQNRCSSFVDEEYFFIRGCLFYLLFSSHSENSKQVEYAYNKYFSFLEKHFPNYMKNKHVGLFRPKSENASVRAIVWFFLILKKIGLAKAFTKLWSKISK